MPTHSKLNTATPDLVQDSAAESQAGMGKVSADRVETPLQVPKASPSSSNVGHAAATTAFRTDPFLSPRVDLDPGQLPNFSSVDTSLWAQSLEESLSTPQKLLSTPATLEDTPCHVPSKMDTDLAKETEERTSLLCGLDLDAPNSGNVTDKKENSVLKDFGQASKRIDDDENPRNSIHLQNMRISQHLRSGSLLSWDEQSKDSRTERPSDNIQSDLHRNDSLPVRRQYHRENSSTGFESCKVPSRWGSVLRPNSTNGVGQDIEERSSVYSSRPQSPPDSIGFMHSLPPIFGNGYQSLSEDDDATIANPEPMQPSEGEETPKATKKVIPETPYSVITENNAQKDRFADGSTSEPPRRRLPKSKSLMRFLDPRSHTKDSLRSHSESNFVDGPDDDADVSRGGQMSRSMMSLRTEQKALERQPDSSNMWEKALKAYHEERSSMFLSPNKGQATRGSPFRERSSSFTRQHPLAETPGTERSESPGAGLFPPPSRRAAAVAHDLNEDPMAEIRKEFHAQTESSAAVGAWGKYPSHSRPERTSSAGLRDDVQTRDFALEAAIKFAIGADVDPVDPSPESAQSKKKKKKVGTISQSQSLSLGRQFIKGYTRMFRSQSTEFRRHGHGHRTSIAAGGALEYPELEILPEVFASRQGSLADLPRTDGAVDAMHDGAQDAHDIKGKKKTDGAPSTTQSDAIRVNSSSTLGVASEAPSSVDRARVWSSYYEDCVAAFPRNSTDTNGKQASSTAAHSEKPSKRHSADVKMAPGHSAAKSNETSASLPTRLRAGHERNLSAISVISEASGLSGSRSVSSVRQSTLDLLQMYRQREIQERERVLSMLDSTA